MPSKAFLEWNKQAQIHLMLWRNSVRRLSGGGWQPIFEPVNCCAAFYRQSRTGDAVGYYQALADALEEAGIVENDALIIQWDGSRMLVDKENPRIEVELKLII